MLLWGHLRRALGQRRQHSVDCGTAQRRGQRMERPQRRRAGALMGGMARMEPGAALQRTLAVWTVPAQEVETGRLREERRKRARPSACRPPSSTSFTSLLPCQQTGKQVLHRPAPPRPRPPAPPRPVPPRPRPRSLTGGCVGRHALQLRRQHAAQRVQRLSPGAQVGVGGEQGVEGDDGGGEPRGQHVLKHVPHLLGQAAEEQRSGAGAEQELLSAGGWRRDGGVGVGEGGHGWVGGWAGGRVGGRVGGDPSTTGSEKDEKTCAARSPSICRWAWLPDSLHCPSRSRHDGAGRGRCTCMRDRAPAGLLGQGEESLAPAVGRAPSQTGPAACSRS